MVWSLLVAAGIVVSGAVVTWMGVELTFFPPQDDKARRRVRIALAVSFACLLAFTLWGTKRGEDAMSALPQQIAQYLRSSESSSSARPSAAPLTTVTPKPSPKKPAPPKVGAPSPSSPGPDGDQPTQDTIKISDSVAAKVTRAPSIVAKVTRAPETVPTHEANVSPQKSIDDPVVQFSRDTYPLPIELPAHAQTLVLVIHDDQTASFERHINSNPQPISWGEDLIPGIMMVSKYTLTNQSKVIIYDVRIEITVDFLSDSGGGKPLFTTEVNFDYGILTPGIPVVLYVVNEFHNFANITMPKTLRGQVEGESFPRRVDLGQVFRNPLDALPFPLPGRKSH